jgi:hypothetical protein
MMRRKRTKDAVEGEPGEGKVDATMPSATSSAMAPVKEPTGTNWLIKQVPGFITSPFGQTFQTRRSRPWPDDEIQYVAGFWDYDIKGYWDVGSPGLADPAHYNAAENQLERSYKYLVSLLQLSRKPKPYSDSLITTGFFAMFMNAYIWAVAYLVYLNCCFMMGQYSEAFQRMSTYLPDRMVRIYRLWQRLNYIVVPNAIKAIGINHGMIVSGQRHPTPHISIPMPYRTAQDGFFGGDTQMNSSYTHYTGAGHTYFVAELLNSGTNIDGVLDDVEAVILGLEGNMTAGGAGADYVTDIKNLRQILNWTADVDEFKPKYSQGLPSLQSLPPMLVDDAKLNDWYCRALTVHDTMGLSTDEYIVFPVTNMAGLGDRIPIKGWGEPGMEEFTLFGATKFGASFDDDTDGLNHMETSVKVRLMGCRRHMGYSTTDFGKMFEIYTREDEWVEIDEHATDFGDGSDVASFMNAGSPTKNHIYDVELWRSQLDTDVEFRYHDQAPVDYEFWAEQGVFGENHALAMANMTGLPPLM